MLHARGDVSDMATLRVLIIWYAPRTWRCFHSMIDHSVTVFVCSTHVEMFPHCRREVLVPHGMLHARGDVSQASLRLYRILVYAPRTWRCFRRLHPCADRGGVCSTHVEMFLLDCHFLLHSLRMLHARGDVSMDQVIYKARELYAPRTWRCFHHGWHSIFSL